MIAIPVLPPRPTHRIPQIKPDPLEQSAQETLRQLIDKETFLLADKQRIASQREAFEFRDKVTTFRLEIVQRNIAAIRQLVGEMEPLPF